LSENLCIGTNYVMEPGPWRIVTCENDAHKNNKNEPVLVELQLN